MGRWGRVLRIGSVDSSKSCASTDVLKSQIVENERLERRLARNCRFFRRLLADPIPLRGQASKNPFLPTRFWATNVHDRWFRRIVKHLGGIFGRSRSGFISKFSHEKWNCPIQIPKIREKLRMVEIKRNRSVAKTEK